VPVPESVPQDGIEAIAQCSAALEVVRLQDGARECLKKTLPTWTRDGLVGSHAEQTKGEIFDNIPFSDSEIQQAWGMLCACEIEGSACKPAPSDLLTFWKEMLSAVFAEGIRIENGFNPQTLWALVEDVGYPRTLFDAVISRLRGDRMDIDRDMGKQSSRMELGKY
jgi:Sister chromatid cohesion protein Dcc1